MDEKEKVELLVDEFDEQKKKSKKEKKEKAPKEEKPKKEKKEKPIKTDEEKSESKKKAKTAVISVIIVAGLVLGMVFGPSLYLKLRDKDGFDLFGEKDAKATLLIYMIGANEKGQNATNDLNEIVNSGVDLSKSNIVVYKNDGGHDSIYELNANGFLTVNVLKSSSTSEAESLTQFLNYGFENYKADEMALVIWNHSENQFSLQEINGALNNSQFKDNNKLSWIGFDASFMATAEAVCTLDAYAEFLVASQEVATYLGWDYSFLKHLGISDTKIVLDELAAAYANACKDCFDASISCIDLSRANDLEESINALFKAMTDKVETDYNALAFARANARGIGKATLGLETDLVDVGAMAEGLLSILPVEAKVLQLFVEEMVVANEGTAEGLCGLSLYYPFFNKSLFESEKEAYAQNGVFSDYKAYLEKYSEIWLQNDKVNSILTVGTPALSTVNKYTLELDEAQRESFVAAKYYVLTKTDENIYTPIYTSSNVEYNNGVLTANFDGNIIYAKDNFYKYVVPVVYENDTVNNIARYSILGSVNDSRYLSPLEETNFNSKNCRFNLLLNTLTEKVVLGGVMPCDDNFVSTIREASFDLTKYTSYCLPQNNQLQLVRNENGIISAVSDWQEIQNGTTYDMPIGDGLEFAFEPLTTGEYYIMFEILDTQGNKYCSEMLTITQTHEMSGTVITPQAISVDWETGEEVLLFSQFNVDVYLTTIEADGKRKYAYKFVNNNAYPIFVESNGAVLNGEVVDVFAFSCGEYVPANSTVVMSECLTISDTSIGALQSASVTIFVRNADNKTAVVYNQPVTVNFSNETGKYFK